MSTDAALQKLIVDRLMAFAPLVALVGERVYDRPPSTRSFPYLSIGPHDVAEDDADCIEGDSHAVQIDVWSRSPAGFAECKKVTEAARDALHKYAGTPETGALVEMRVTGRRYLGDPDGLTSHGVLTVAALMEKD